MLCLPHVHVGTQGVQIDMAPAPPQQHYGSSLSLLTSLLLRLAVPQIPSADIVYV
jgi:hypothetical protein